MAYSRGNLAKNVGAYCRYMATACRRARDTLDCCVDGLIGNTSATLSSLASISDATSRNARARRLGFSCAVAKYASTKTRNSTISADGAGNSSGVLGSADGHIRPSERVAREPRINERSYLGVGRVSPTQIGAS